MSWFESVSIASLAKSAIKEAQKTIDKALDINEDKNLSTTDIVSNATASKENKISLKEESENFFQTFGVTGGSNQSIDTTNPIVDDESPSKTISTKKMVGSLWGSFSESFFENQKTYLSEKASKGGPSTSAPVTPSGSGYVVATQPPRIKASLPDSSLQSESSATSGSSSIVQLSEEMSSPSSIEFSSIPEEMDEKSRQFKENDSGGGWEWDSNIDTEDSIIPKLDIASLDEDSLADDAIDPDGFSRSRLIVGSVDSESSSKSVLEDQNLHSLSEEVFCDQSNFVLENENGSRPSSTVNNSSQSDGQLESPESIIVLDSNSNSPIDVICGDKISFSCNADLSINSTESSEIISTSNSIASPSSNSIEVLSPCSIDSLQTLEDIPSLSDTYQKFSDQAVSLGGHNKNLTSIEERLSGSELDKHWIEESENMGTITKQPLAAIKLRHQETQDNVDDLDYCDTSTPIHSSFISAISEESSMSESVHSASTSSTITILDASLVPENSPLAIHDICERESYVLEEKFESFEPSIPVSMNAGEIRKNLDRVDKKTLFGIESLKATNDLHMKTVDSMQAVVISKYEDVDAKNDIQNITPLELSSRSESSTETITASFDSQHMSWSNLAVLDICRENVASVDLVKKPVEDLLEEAISDDKTKIESKDERELVSPLFERELSPSSSDRSDVLKIPSSGQSSADEIETATSSDIEVISSPSIDGSNNGASRSYNVPPSVASKVWMTAQKGFRSFLADKGEFRKDSYGLDRETIPSSMTTSFTSISESDGDSPHLPHSELLQLEASRMTQVLLQDINLYGKGHRRNQSNLSETSESSSELQTPETEKLWKKITKLTDILESRETKVLELSHANMALQESNQLLKSRVEEFESLKMGSEATELVREEFTQRLGTMEKKFQQALREKEAIKRQLEEYRTEVASRRSNADVIKELTEKETTISELRHEGEKLSKQQLNYSNITKKLRAKEKEADSCITEQNERIESLSDEQERLRKQLNAKEEVERRQIEAIRQYTITHQRQDILLKDLAAENAEVEGKMVTLKEALDSAYREIAVLQRSALTKDAELQSHALSTEVTVRQKFETALCETNMENKREKETLFAQILEHKDDLNRLENQANRKERLMKTEITYLQERLSESETRTDEISSSVSAATRPLMRQLDHLQSTHAAQQATWDVLEESLSRRLNDAQNAVIVSGKKEREAKEQLADQLNSMSTLQSQVSSLQAEKTAMKTNLETIGFKCSSLEAEKAKDWSQLEVLKKSFAEEILEVKRERDILEQQLDLEKMSVSSEKKKVLSLVDQVKERDKRVSQLQVIAVATNSHTSSPRSSPTLSLSRLSTGGSVNESFSGSHWGDDVFDPSYMKGASIYDSLRGNSAATIEILTSNLHQKEGDLNHLQTEVSRLEAQKESLAQELVQASRTAEQQTNTVRQFDRLKLIYKDMEQKYNALLQMYGEKVEEVEELRMDLADVKEMYRLQIDQLMQK